MKTILNRLGGVWIYSAMIVTVLFVISIVIYGLDIKSSGSRKALTRELKNEGKINYYYRIDDTFALGVFSDREPGELDIHVTAYTQNFIPFCYFCGYYAGSPDDNRGFLQPYRQGDLLYAIEPLAEAYMGLPEGAYATLNVKTGEFSHVMNLSEIHSDALNDKYRVTREYVSTNFDEMSYSSSDDEDCFIAFGAVFLSYFILIIWGLFAILFRRPKITT